MKAIERFHKALGYALALTAAGGDRDRIKRDHYGHARDAQRRFDRAADTIFFPHLWDRFDAQEKGDDALKAEEKRFARALFHEARAVFEAALPAVPCAGIFRPRAEARAERAFLGAIWRDFPEVRETPDREESEDVA